MTTVTVGTSYTKYTESGKTMSLYKTKSLDDARIALSQHLGTPLRMSDAPVDQTDTCTMWRCWPVANNVWPVDLQYFRLVSHVKKPDMFLVVKLPGGIKNELTGEITI